MARVTTWIATLALLLGTLSAAAQTDQTLRGKSLRIKVSAQSTGNKLVFSLRDGAVATPVPGSAEDPTVAGSGGGGGYIEFRSAAGPFILPLAATNWSSKASGTTFRYKDPVGGAFCRSVVIRNGGLVKGACKSGLVDVPLGGSLTPVEVVVTTGVGPHRYCGSFGGTVIKDGLDGSVFLAKDADAPARCACGTFVDTWYTPSAGAGPEGITVDGSGHVYVAETDNDRIQKFSSGGISLLTFGSSGAGNGQFVYPRDVAVDAAGNIYVVDQISRVQKFDSSGVFLASWGTLGSGDTQFQYPEGVAVDSSGNVYVADTGNSRIQKFSSTGTFLTKWGTAGSGDGEFSLLRDVAVDGAGNVYAADSGNYRIQKFSDTGTFLTKWGSSGNGDGQFVGPLYGIGVDPAGNVYAADFGLDRIQMFTSAGVLVAKWGRSGSQEGYLETPADVAVDGVGNVYVAEYGPERISRFVCP